MKYLKIKNNIPVDYNISSLKFDYPNTSFPRPLTNVALAEFDIFPYTASEKPEYDDSIYIISPGEFEKVEEEWIRHWNLTELTSQQKIKRKEQNAAVASEEQKKTIQKLFENEKRKEIGIPPLFSDTDEPKLKEYVKKLQSEIDFPSTKEAYNPPLPPGVNPPAVNTLNLKITRIPGWNDVLGWKAEIVAGEDNFTPNNLAMAEYTNPDCDGYLYTTGAFQYTDGVWNAICPAGQEKGDVDINLGLLYGAALLSCFTLKAGVQEQTIYAYEEQ